MRAQRALTARLLDAQGLDDGVIAHLLGVSRRTVEADTRLALDVFCGSTSDSRNPPR
jgi:hypothetical protein